MLEECEGLKLMPEAGTIESIEDGYTSIKVTGKNKQTKMKINKKYNNPALHESSIGEPALIIAPRDSESVFKWIKSSGRFKSHEEYEYHGNKAAQEIEDILDQEEELDEE